MKIAFSIFTAVTFGIGTPLIAGDVLRDIIVEADPIAPASSFYEQGQSGVSTTKWGVGVDFILLKGPDMGSAGVRREDFWPGERQKIEATRFRWNLGYWQQPSSMRGWYVKMAYSYTKINSRANRYTEALDQNTGLTTVKMDEPLDETDLITDTRHGISAAIGSRWFIYERLTASIGASVTQNFRRSIDVDSSDANAKADYEALINNNIPDTRMSVRPTPEVNIVPIEAIEACHSFYSSSIALELFC
ncbi:MAG: hypothetical protein NT027_03310 [Proteobacteria bacterium]|nr:hypothetical protein [Pseudomonadota bacterium]